MDGQGLIAIVLPLVSVGPDVFGFVEMTSKRAVILFCGGAENQTEPTLGWENTILLRFDQGSPREVKLELSFQNR